MVKSVNEMRKIFFLTPLVGVITVAAKAVNFVSGSVQEAFLVEQSLRHCPPCRAHWTVPSASQGIFA